MHGTNSFSLPLCPVCGESFARKLSGRRKKYCSDQCRLESHRTNRKAVQRLKNGARYPHEGLQRNDAKSACGPDTFLAGFAGRPPDICGPRDVIAIELDREWTETTSTDGVRSFVSIIRPRALRDGGTA